MLKSGFILITDIIDSENLLKKGYSELSAVWKRHETLVIPLAEYFGGEVIHESSGNIFIRFENGVKATLCAIKIQEAHHHWKEGLPPPSIRILICKIPDQGESKQEVMDFFSKNRVEVFLSAGDKGDVLTDEETSLLWHEYGNRNLKDEIRTVVYENEEFKLGIIDREERTREPLHLRKLKSWFYVFAVIIPAAVLLFLNLSVFSSDSGFLDRPVILTGNFVNEFGSYDCKHFAKTVSEIKGLPYKTINFCNYDQNFIRIPEGSLQISGFVTFEKNQYTLILYKKDPNTGTVKKIYLKKYDDISKTGNFIKNAVYNLIQPSTIKERVDLSVICGVKRKSDFFIKETDGRYKVAFPDKTALDLSIKNCVEDIFSD